MDFGEIEVRDVPEDQRYEARVGASLFGFIDYRIQPALIALLHTEVDPEYRGRGIGSRLVAGALDDVRNRGLSVLPSCPFVRAYIRRHPEYSHLVAHS